MKLIKLLARLLLWCVLMLVMAGLLWLLGLDLITGTLIVLVLGTLAVYGWSARHA